MERHLKTNDLSLDLEVDGSGAKIGWRGSEIGPRRTYLLSCYEVPELVVLVALEHLLERLVLDGRCHSDACPKAHPTEPSGGVCLDKSRRSVSAGLE